MESLRQKYHGLPGVGVNGLPGSKGQPGNRVYFGHINRFFNLEEIDLSPYVKLGIRNIDTSVQYNEKDYAYKTILKEVITKEISDLNIYNNNQSVDALVDTTHRFYTGGVYFNQEEQSLNSYFIDLDNNVALIQSMFSNDIELNNNSFVVKGMDEFSMPAGTNKLVTFTSIFQHTTVQDTNKKILGDAENAKIGTVANYFTGYEINDASNMAGGTQFTLLDENLNTKPYEANKCYPYIKEAFVKDGTSYILDTSTAYGIINMSNNIYSGYCVYDLTLNNGSLVRMFPQGSTPYTDTSLANKSALRVQVDPNSTLFSDSDYQYYGLSNSKLYNADGTFKGVDNIWNDVSTMPPFSNNKSATEKYLYTYVITPDENSSKFISWTDTGMNMIIPTYLDTSTYKVGDTIYFYLSEVKPGEDVEILFCITLTESLLSQPVNIEDFINSAQIVNPFKVQYLVNKDLRVTSYFPCNTYLDDTSVYSDTSSYTIESIEGIINSFTDNALLITDDKYNSSIATYVNLRAFDDKHNYDISANMLFNTSLATTPNSSTMFVLDVSSLKLSSFYVNKDNIYDKLEQKKHLEDSNIIKDEGFIAPTTEYSIYHDKKGSYYGYLLKAEDYFYDFSEDCLYGYEIYDSSCLVCSEVTKDTSLMVRIDPSTNTFTYNVFVFAATKNCGIKYYSKCASCTFDNDTSSLDTSILGEGTTFINNQTSNIEVITTPISAEKCTGINLSFNPINDKVVIQDITFNNKSLTNSEWSNYWAKVTYNNGAYTMDVSNNLPNINGYNPDTILEYMTSGNEIAEEESKVDSYIFAIRNKGAIAPKTNRRYVRAIVKYNLTDTSGDFYETHDIVQPGFTDYRDVPQISLKLHNNINDLEKYNTLDKGVLCNHFRTYLDVNIEDFYEKWGRYISDPSVSVSLNFTIQNTANDLNWRRQYNVPDYILRPTVKLLPDNTSLNNGDYAKNISYKNYVKLTVKALDVNSDIDGLTSAEIWKAQSPTEVSIDSSWYMSSIDTSIDSKDYVVINDEEYVCLTSNIVSNTCSEPNIISHGLYDDIKIQFNDIDFSKAKNNTYQFAIDYELGNPVISNLYMQFVVTDVSICISKTGEDSSIFVASIDASSMQTYNDMDSYLYKITDKYNEQYTFCSEPLDAMFNPLSFIACPAELETGIGTIQLATVKKTGSTAQIQNTMKFYGLPLYSKSDLMGTLDSYSARMYRYWKWNSLLLKSKYFQDNVGSISAKPIDPKTIESKLNGQYLPIIGDVSTLFDYDTIDSISNKQYYALIYRAGIMTPKSSNGVEAFNYQNKDYEAIRYKQYERTSPLFTSQSAAIEIRDAKMLDSMNVWNFEYTTYTSAKGLEANAKVFYGITNEYANGFNYLSNSQDTGQYGYKTTIKTNDYGYKTKIGQFTINDIYSLIDTKDLANRYVYTAKQDKELDVQTYGANEPKSGGYLRTLLYDLKWEYPAYTNNKIEGYRLVSDFDYLAKFYDKSGLPQNDYLKECNKLNSSTLIKAKDNKIIPSALLYELTPRIAYNSDYDTINCLMLRCPVIGTDNDKLTDDNKIYALNKRYYDMVNYQEIDYPYNP